MESPKSNSVNVRGANWVPIQKTGVPDVFCTAVKILRMVTTSYSEFGTAYVLKAVSSKGDESLKDRSKLCQTNALVPMSLFS